MHRHHARLATIRTATALATILATAWTCGAAGLTVEDRIAYRRLVEDVYWQNRTWPQGDMASKPPLSQVLPENVLRDRVEDTMRMSTALEERRQRPITTDDLQTELDRMVRDTAAPERLEELFQALGRDPQIIAEVIARPLVADRRAREAFASDPEIHDEVRRRAKNDVGSIDSIDDMRSVNGRYREVEWLLLGESGVKRETMGPDGETERIFIKPGRWEEKIDWLDDRLGDANPGEISGLREDPDRLSIVAVLERGDRRIRIASVEWPKPDFDSWWTANRDEYAAAEPPTLGSYELGAVKSVSATPDSWQAVGSAGSPPHARSNHSTIFTGSEMIVWGGDDGIGYVYSGSRYDPATDNWSAMTNTGHPLGRLDHTAVWTGDEMIVWGGDRGATTNTGGRYSPTTNTWLGMTTAGAPSARVLHTAVWTLDGTMAVWGGWSGSSYLGNGATYNPSNNTWSTLGTSGAPGPRGHHTAVVYRVNSVICSTYEIMVVFGGRNATSVLGDGAFLCTVDGEWTTLSSDGAPSPRMGHSAIVDPDANYSKMIVWGGNDGTNDLITGAIWEYEFGAYNVWTPTTLGNVPAPRQGHSAIWAGTGMMVWGGFSGPTLRNTGGIYNPDNNVWLSMTTSGAPTARKAHSAVWSRSSGSHSEGEMIVWGGHDGAPTASGGLYSRPEDFVIECSPRTLFSVPGGYEPFDFRARVDADGSFNDTVTLSHTAFPGSLTIWNSSFVPSFSGTSTDVDLWVDAGASIGDHSFFLKGTSGATTRLYKMTLRVQDFDLSCQPTSVTIAPGGSASATCTVSSINDFGDPVALDCPRGLITCSSSPSSVTPPRNGTIDAQLTITVEPAVSPGTHTIHPTALSHFAERISPITVIVADPATLIFADDFESGDTSAW